MTRKAPFLFGKLCADLCSFLSKIAGLPGPSFCNESVDEKEIIGENVHLLNQIPQLPKEPFRQPLLFCNNFCTGGQPFRKQYLLFIVCNKSIG